MCIKQYPSGDIAKVKMVIDISSRMPEITKTTHPSAVERWQFPSLGWVKLKVDGSYIPVQGVCGAAMVLRDEAGVVIFSASRFLLSCSSAM